MAATHFTLAALATAAVPGLTVAGASPFNSGDEFASALVTDIDGAHWLARAPLNPQAESRQSAELVALTALTTGVRRRLPFSVPAFAGQAPMGDSRVIVYDFLDGDRVPMSALKPAETLTISVGHSLAAIHSLPISVVVDAGLPSASTSDCLRASVALIDRAEQTQRMPSALLERWDRVITVSELWQFQPTVIHGAMSVDSLLVRDNLVVGMLDWGQLRIGDPATDLHWLLAGTAPSVAETAFDSYAVSRQVPVDRAFRLRSRFYAELELARWLLHGSDQRDDSIMDDAVSMMEALLEQVDREEPLLAEDREVPLDIDEVRAMLSREHPSIYPPTQPGRTLAADE